MAGIFTELTLIIGLAIFVIYLIRLLKQPLIIGYIITGILVSPSLLNLVKSQELITTLSELGVVILLFMVGLSLNPKVIKEVGGVSIITGLGQVLFTSIVGFLIGLALGFSAISALYIAIALTFSSTIIILKLLSDKGDTDKQYGKIAIGLLIVQDLIAIIALMIITSFSNGSISVTNYALTTFSVGIALIGGLFLIGHFLIPRITDKIAENQEYLLLFSLAWCFAIATLFSYFGFSIEIGALLAGVSLSLSPYRFEISSRLKPLRDFFIFMFFIWLGSQITLGSVTSNIPAIIAFSLFILIGNPLILIILMGSLGYKKRTSFLLGLVAAQISEFSLILIATGVRLGQIPQELLSLTTVVGLITIAGSTYFISYSDKIYPKISKYLTIFERKTTKKENKNIGKKYDTILFGAHRTGYNIIHALKDKKKNLLIVDYDPERIKRLSHKKYNCVFGDISDPDLLDEIDLCNAKMIISTIPDLDTNLLFIKRLKLCNPSAIILVVAEQVSDSFELYKQGATYVITPHFIGGKHIAEKIKNYGLDIKNYQKERESHKKHLDNILEDDFTERK